MSKYRVPSITKSRAEYLAMFLLFFLELELFTFMRNVQGPLLSPLLLLFVSLAICGLPLLSMCVGHYDNSYAPKLRFRLEDKKTQVLVVTGIFIIGGIASGIDLAHVFQSIEISPKSSDIIPLLQIFTQRLLAGEYPYSVYEGFGYTLYPTYPPMTWLPYVISEVLAMDYRWIAFAIFLLGVLAYESLVVANSSRLFETAAKAVLPFLVLRFFRLTEPAVFGMTIEMMTVGYYLLLAASIFSGSNLFRALTLILCLLSRYSLVFWAPLYIALLFFAERRKNAMSISLMISCGILFIYVVPFLSHDWHSFFRGYACYTTAALDEWQRVIPGVLDGKPFHLFRGIGFAALFYEFGKGSLLERLLSLKRFHLLASVSSVLLAGILFLHLKKHVNYRMYSLLSLKFTLVFFYAFIQVPYIYLNLVPVFLSLPIVAVLEWDRNSCVSAPQ